jgi:PKD repeat protein
MEGFRMMNVRQQLAGTARPIFRRLCGALALSFGLAAGAADAGGRDVARERILQQADNRPLTSLRAAAERGRAAGYRPGPPREVINFRGEGESRFSGPTQATEGIMQTTAGANRATTLSAGFFGASNNDNGTELGFLIAPPDTDGQVGFDSAGNGYYLQMINLLTTVFDLNGNVISGPFASNVFWAGIGGNCEPNNQGDPIVLYDDQAQRWLVSQFAFPDDLSTFSQCVAISRTGDPTGGYNRYEFNFDSFGFNDYPKHGITTDSITMMANLFTERRGGGPFGGGFTFAGSFLGVMDKAAMYAGNPASLIGFNIGSNEFGFVAGDLDGPGTAPNLFATAMSTAGVFDIWRIDVDWASQNASVNQIAAIPISPFDNDFCGAAREACIPQPNNGPALEAIGDRLMHRLQIRDFGSYRTMVTAHSVDVGGGRAGIRWYEMRDAGAGWSLHQEGTYAPNDGENRWMPSIAMNAAGDIGVGYMLSSTSTFVSTAITGQTASASGTGMFDAGEQFCANGSGVQLDVNRAGDYSSTSVDENTGTFWHTNEVFTQTGQFQWNTYVCSFTVGTGGGNVPPNAAFASSCNNLDCSFDGSASSDSDGSIVAYAWDYGDGNGGSGQVVNHSYAAEGGYSVTLTVTDDGGASASTTQTVTVDDGINDPPVADLAFDCNGLSCSFDGSGSSDADGTIVAYDWDYGDGNGGSGATVSHSYAADGSYVVSLTVTDDGGATATATASVSVADIPISLSVNGRKQRGRHILDYSWSGAGSSQVDIVRDGLIVATTANDGAFTENTGNTGGASYVLQVCEAGTGTCSNTVTVNF